MISQWISVLFEYFTFKEERLKDNTTYTLLYNLYTTEFLSVTWKVVLSLLYLKAFLTLEQQTIYRNQFQNVSCFQAAICKFGVM